MKAICLKCGTRFSTRNTLNPKCPTCGSHDITLPVHDDGARD